MYLTIADVLSGVPQGTVLAPLLFLLYVNDLPHRVYNKVKLYADNVLLYSPIYSVADCAHLQEDLNLLSMVCHMAYELQFSQV